MNREIDYLTDTNEFKTFVQKYNLRLRLADKYSIYLLSGCYIIQFYALITEDQFYVNFYSNDLKCYASASTLLSTIDNRELIKNIYREERVKRKFPIRAENNNDERRLSAEREFFAYLKMMDQFLSEYLRCIKMSHASDLFSPTSKAHQDSLKHVFGKE
jgi:hypothetical protein